MGVAVHSHRKVGYWHLACQCLQVVHPILPVAYRSRKAARYWEVSTNLVGVFRSLLAVERMDRREADNLALLEEIGHCYPQSALAGREEHSCGRIRRSDLL